MGILQDIRFDKNDFQFKGFSYLDSSPDEAEDDENNLSALFVIGGYNPSQCSLKIVQLKAKSYIMMKTLILLEKVDVRVVTTICEGYSQIIHCGSYWEYQDATLTT
ncbi:hypothetical protein DAPPUDRAFT_317802 [Daphnia pulex]|uniref:Uncharacterized protein n=1 Tax=Daphnia pulex TaxID=6669 RepID=E9GH10_DAPPU|nr:hypothetical protein DAPPUDRAFT_317802 [Daphnia pulex]|eukprot:EFX81119.1 hypothetical protein DAPPUDRAFT_317802 [Daphnia pulex]